MASQPSNLELEDLLSRARAGDESALAILFNHHRERLRKMIRLRMDRRLSGRVDSSDVLQDAYLNRPSTAWTRSTARCSPSGTSST